jgi:glucose-6-phosphate dehydrogenase assembly protein OpcA
MAAAISSDRILKELADLWVSLGKKGQEEAGAGVLRACTMTLIVLAEESEDPAEWGETIAALMPEHPARTIHVRLCQERERALSERVYAECWMPFGQRRQICCEQVEISVGDAALGDLPSVVLPLTVPDLPVILWARTVRLLGMPEFRAIASMARKVIVDSAAMPDPADAIRRLDAARGRGVVLGDLAWTRLTRWRETISQVFENRERLARLASVKGVAVNYGGTYETSARLMAAWLADALAQAGAAPQLEVARSEDVPTLRVALEGEGLRVDLARSDETLLVTVNEAAQHISLPYPTDYLVMREELSVVRRDPVLERTLSSAARLAYPEGK